MGEEEDGDGGWGEIRRERVDEGELKQLCMKRKNKSVKKRIFFHKCQVAVKYKVCKYTKYKITN